MRGRLHDPNRTTSSVKQWTQCQCTALVFADGVAADGVPFSYKGLWEKCFIYGYEAPENTKCVSNSCTRLLI